MSIISFDVFDTCIMRQVADPPCIFELTANRLGLAAGYKAIRIEAEREAVRCFGEATLGQIYSIVSQWLSWSGDLERKAYQTELEIEEEQLFAVPDTKLAVANARAQGKRIAFLSDTYFPSLFLKRVLEREGFYREGDVVLASCEHGVSKRDGGLYSVAARILETSSWHHTGNCERADVYAARCFGLEAEHFAWGNLTRYEQILLENADSTPESAWWASAAREARIALGRLGRYERSVAAVSSAVAGPFALLFSDWIACRADRLGIGNLFFLARDGQALIEPFSKITQAKGLSISSTYIHASRISWRFPKEFPLSARDAKWLFQCGRDWIQKSVVAARLGVSEEEICSWLPEAAVKGNVILLSRVDEILASLAKETVIEVLRKVAAKREELWLEYLVQQGLTRQSHIGIVDLGWNGSLQIALEELFGKHGISTKVTGFYYGLKRSPEALNIDAYAFGFDCRRAAVKESTMLDSTLAELFMHADHGSTLGFGRLLTGEVVPRLDEKDGINALVPDWFEIHRVMINEFVDGVIKKRALPVAAAACLPVLHRLMEQFWRYPSRDEARAWGSIEFSSDGLCATQAPIASNISSLRDFVWVLGSGVLGRGKALWREGGGALLPAKLDRLSRVFSSLKSGSSLFRALLHLRKSVGY